MTALHILHEILPLSAFQQVCQQLIGGMFSVPNAFKTIRRLVVHS